MAKSLRRWIILQQKYVNCKDPKSEKLFESFEAKKQVGSSTMPHKQNPETCERVCGLARIVRSLAVPALEDMVTWHERDLTQSSAERFMLPESCILLDYILNLMSNIVANLRVDEQRMLQNLVVDSGTRHVRIRHDGADKKRRKPARSPRTATGN